MYIRLGDRVWGRCVCVCVFRERFVWLACAILGFDIVLFDSLARHPLLVPNHKVVIAGLYVSGSDLRACANLGNIMAFEEDSTEG